MHLYINRSKLPRPVVPYPFGKNSKGYERIPLVDHATGSAHQAVGICELQPGGLVDNCLHTNDEGIYVIEGELDLLRDGRVYQLRVDGYALVPYGVPHAYRNRGGKAARWVEISVPQPKLAGGLQDTFFFAGDWPEEVSKGDCENTVIQAVGHFNEVRARANIADLEIGTRGLKNRPLFYPIFGTEGFLLRRGLLEAGDYWGPHDHAIEEWHYALAGELKFNMEDKIYHLKPGDVTWTGVGAMHYWNNTGEIPYCWIETYVPGMYSPHGLRNYPYWDKWGNLQNN
jgi:mannose-6-phosphate isomerase-like protein (cupin superfamily)